MSSRFFSFLGTQLADITSALVAFPAIMLSEVTSIIGINNPHHHYIPSPSSPPLRPTRGGLLKSGGERVNVVLVNIVCLHWRSPPPCLTAQNVAGGKSLPGTGDKTLVSQLLEIFQISLRQHFLKILSIISHPARLGCPGRINIRDLNLLIIILYSYIRGRVACRL